MNLIQKHVKEVYWIRDLLIDSDERMSVKPILGVESWDDAVCIDFSGRLVVSSDGPYTKRLVLKSALIHAAGDVVVKGAKPLFTQDTVIGGKQEVKQMLKSLKIQSQAIDCPLCGGNTLYEDTDPRCSLTVIGELLLDEPISDAKMKEGDVVCLLGEPIWGSQSERIQKTQILWNTWFQALKQIIIHSSKDVTKGGITATVYEMETKSGKKIKLKDKQPYPMGRNLDNFILTLTEDEYKRLEGLCRQKGCVVKKIGTVLKS